MQHEIDALPSAPGRLPIAILGINQAGEERGNASMCAGRTIPWLQDNAQEHVWGGKWDVVWRDVFVLDGDNHVVAIYNLTQHDLGMPANYAYLRDLLLQTATTH